MCLCFLIAYTILKSKYMIDYQQWGLTTQTIMASDELLGNLIKLNEHTNVTMGLQFNKARAKVSASEKAAHEKKQRDEKVSKGNEKKEDKGGGKGRQKKGGKGGKGGRGKKPEKKEDPEDIDFSATSDPTLGMSEDQKTVYLKKRYEDNIKLIEKYLHIKGMYELKNGISYT